MQLAVGRVGRAHGVRGEVAVEVRTDEPERRFAAGTMLRPDPGVGALTVTAARWHQGRLLVTFAEVTDRTAAQVLQGALLLAEIDPSEVPADPDEFYDHQLVGLEVRTVGGEPVGAVTDVAHLPGQDLLAVRRPDGTEVLVPFVKALVPEVDLAGRRVWVDPPPGLLDPAQAE